MGTSYFTQKVPPVKDPDDPKIAALNKLLGNHQVMLLDIGFHQPPLVWCQGLRTFHSILFLTFAPVCITVRITRVFVRDLQFLRKRWIDGRNVRPNYLHVASFIA